MSKEKIAKLGKFDDPGSKYFISAGILRVQADLGGSRWFIGRNDFYKCKKRSWIWS
ncbi:MAG: hypothetical protein KKI18_00970 [Planctomycetes bacterium]|nr:hypothetical protein [Planctomycetota bacterium]MBU1517475.1 hypothetical protein [Planctomycetota bacterium]